MGKGTDKLYITHSEWASEDAFSASAGASTSRPKDANAFRRLPFNFCALSLQPFQHPMCTAEGTTFDLTHILPWLKKHGTNPVTGKPLKSSELIKLHYTKNEEGDFVDPVTFKAFTDNTHIVALATTGNAFAYDTIEKLNIKAKSWRDLISDEEFSRKDIIVLQDPQNVELRNLSSFKHIKDGVEIPAGKSIEEATLDDDKESASIRITKAKEAIALARNRREAAASKIAPNQTLASKSAPREAHSSKSTPYNAAQHTTGRAAASFTSTGLTPHTSAERALLTDEEYMLKPKRVKQKGYARMSTNRGDLSIELLPEFAPRAVWNFVQLVKKGYYNGISFHRNIRNFMIQGGDPTGTGKGGQSIWGKNFQDEFEGPATHDAKGILSMANKGKNTNGSQFFITYRAAKHLDRKHTIFGKVVEGLDILSGFENVEVSEFDKRPLKAITITEVIIFVDPFEEFQKAKRQKDASEREKEEIARNGGTEDDKMTWTGKRVRGIAEVSDDSHPKVAKYLKQGHNPASEPTGLEEWKQAKVVKPSSGGFGNFDSW